MYGAKPRALVGRDEVLAAVLESLGRPPGHGAAVAAETGLGKTAFAAVVALELQDRMPVCWVHSSPALKRVPYGALAALLPDLAPGQTGAPPAVMRALVTSLFPRGPAATAAQQPGSEPLVIVDDAHEIDGPSLDLLTQLFNARRIRLLVLTRTFQGVTDVLPHLWDGQLTRHRLEPLTERDVLRLCEQELQDQVSAAAAVELARLTGGNPMYLLALVGESVRSGLLAQQHGIWVITHNEPPVTGRVADLVKAQMKGLNAEERTALELICLAEPVPLQAAFRLGLHEAVDRLSDTLLMAVNPDGEQTLRPVHPLLGEVVRRTVPAARSRRLLSQLQGALTGMEPGTEGRLRLVSWALGLGAEVAAHELLQAAETANDRHDPRVALRAAAAIGNGDLAVEARIQEARALVQLGEGEAAAAALEGTLGQAPHLHAAKQSMLVHVQLALPSATGTEWADRLAGMWISEIRRLVDGRMDIEKQQIGWGAQMLRLLSRIRNGDYAETEAELAAMLRDAQQSGDNDALLVSQAVTAEAQVAMGRAESALEHSTAAMALLRGDRAGSVFGPFVLHRHLSVLLWLGKWEQLQQCIGSGESPVQRTLRHSGGVVDFALGLWHLRTGDLEEASKDFAAAAEAATISDPEGIRPLCLALGFFAAGSLGQRDLAGRLLDAADQMSARGPEQYRLLAQGILAAGRFALGADESARAALRDAAAAAQERSFTAVEFTLCHLSMQLGDFSAAGRLLKVTEGFEGPQAPVLNRVARAAVDQDTTALIALAGEPDPELDLQLARQCLLEAMRIARRGNDVAVMNRIQRLLGQQRGGQPASQPELTRRERDVAALVAAGQRNAEIARALNLSVRTVEGHIYRTYEKLGIRRRDELKARFPLLDNPAAGWKPSSAAE